MQENDKESLLPLKGGRAVGRHLPTGLGPSSEWMEPVFWCFIFALPYSQVRAWEGWMEVRAFWSRVTWIIWLTSEVKINRFLVQVRGSHVWGDYEVMPRVDDCQLEREVETKFYRGKGEIKSWSVAREIWPITTWFCFIGIGDTFLDNFNKKLLRVLPLLFELVCILSAEGL